MNHSHFYSTLIAKNSFDYLLQKKTMAHSEVQKIKYSVELATKTLEVFGTKHSTTIMVHFKLQSK